MLNSSEKEYSKFATEKWYVIDSESKGLKIKKINHKRALELSLSDYFDAYFLVTGNAAVVGANDNTKVAFKNCVPFRKRRAEINETFIYETEKCLCTI